jgi:hypothetical protein
MPRYPLKHSFGYCPLPRDVRALTPLMHEPTGLLLRAYIAIISRARHEAGWEIGSHGNVFLERGQWITGEEKLAEHLGTTRKSARRALLELARLGLIEKQSDKRGSVVTVVNYGCFGDDETSDGTSEGQAGRQATVQARDKLVDTKERRNGETEERSNGYEAPAPRAVPIAASDGVATLDVPELGTQTTLQVYDPAEPAASVGAESAVLEGLARTVIGWLNGVHRAAGRQVHHRGFDPLANDVLKAAKRWRKLKLRPEDVIAVCEQRIAGWKAATPDWLNNCTPRTLFRPGGFDAAREEIAAGFRPIASMAGARGVRPGVATAPNEHYRDKGIGECEI